MFNVQRCPAPRRQHEFGDTYRLTIFRDAMVIVHFIEVEKKLHGYWYKEPSRMLTPASQTRKLVYWTTENTSLCSSLSDLAWDVREGCKSSKLHVGEGAKHLPAAI